MNTTTVSSPFGPLTLAASAAGLTRCTLRPARPGSRHAEAGAPESGAAWLELARRELGGYFAGELREFTVPVDLSRVDQPHRRILEALEHVGYGATTTYGTLAADLGLVEDGPRTVGGAMARNPVWIIVPCHRVLGAGGRLTGYAGGLAVKRRLLDLEARATDRQLALALGSAQPGWGMPGCVLTAGEAAAPAGTPASAAARRRPPGPAA